MFCSSNCFAEINHIFCQFLYLLHQRHRQEDMSSKIGFEITKTWVDSLNATMRVDVHKTWGYYDNKTGQITGMVGQLQRKEADISGMLQQTNLKSYDFSNNEWFFLCRFK